MNTTRPTFRGPRAELPDFSADGPAVAADDPWSDRSGDGPFGAAPDPLAAMVAAYRRLGLSAPGALAWARADYGCFFPSTPEA